MNNLTVFLNRYSALIVLFVLATFCLITLPSELSAQITNPAIGELGGNQGNDGYNPNTGAIAQAKSGSMLLTQFVRYWGIAISIGAIILLGMLVWGGIEWITSAGDKGKLEKARSRIFQSVIGMLVLATSFILVGFVSGLLFGDNFDLLNLNLYFAN